MKKVLNCPICGFVTSNIDETSHCPECGAPLVPRIMGAKGKSPKKMKGIGVWIWQKFLTYVPEQKITLWEGRTPLIRAKNLEEVYGINEIYVKDESRNPTGTFIDRGAAIAVSWAKNVGKHRIVIPSLGDFGVSISAYARKAEIKSTVYSVRSLPTSKYYQTLFLADSVRFYSTYEEALDNVMKIKSKITYPLLPEDPRLVDGYRTLAFEVIEEMEKPPETIVVPVGNGTLIYALWSAFDDFGLNPTFIGVRGSVEDMIIRDIYVEKPRFMNLINSFLKEKGGKIVDITPQEALKASSDLALCEGLFLEPAGASVLHALSHESLEPPIVLITTGARLRDPMIIKRLIESKRGTSYVMGFGVTKLKILEIMGVKRETYPYELWKTLREDYGIHIALRNVYAHIKDLEEGGYIKKTREEKINGRKTIFYTITRKGLRVIF